MYLSYLSQTIGCSAEYRRGWVVDLMGWSHQMNAKTALPSSIIWDGWKMCFSWKRKLHLEEPIPTQPAGCCGKSSSDLRTSTLGVETTSCEIHRSTLAPFWQVWNWDMEKNRRLGIHWYILQHPFIWSNFHWFFESVFCTSVTTCTYSHGVNWFLLEE